MIGLHSIRVNEGDKAFNAEFHSNAIKFSAFYRRNGKLNRKIKNRTILRWDFSVKSIKKITKNYSIDDKYEHKCSFCSLHSALKLVCLICSISYKV